jgi:hypothetical protein
MVCVCETLDGSENHSNNRKRASKSNEILKLIQEGYNRIKLMTDEEGGAQRRGPGKRGNSEDGGGDGIMMLEEDEEFRDLIL